MTGLSTRGMSAHILGTEPFEFVARDYRRPCVVTGFEANDILESVWMMLQQYLQRDWKVEIQYLRAVRPEGNPAARGYLEKVFSLGDAAWRGLGVIPDSGLDIAPAYSEWDARKRFQVERPVVKAEKGKKAPCLCGAILKGLKDPHDCPSFGQACTPLKPVGPCMVSTEGACAAYYRYQPLRSEGR